MSNEVTPPPAADPNVVLFDYRPTGASVATARQDNLPQRGILGVAASRAMAEADGRRVLPLRDKFVAASQRFNVPPALLAAIASRESRGGSALRNGFGDRGNGFGVMQVDKRHHALQGTDDPFGLPHIMQATGILRDSIEQVRRNHPDWSAVRQMQGGVSGYNQGPGKVRTLENMDVGSTGNDYSNDVWARAQFYATQMGSAGRPVPVTPSAGLTPNVTFPSPALPAVLAGASALARPQRGEAVVSLQNALLALKYLVLTDEEKLSGLGFFGPKTELALINFQQDVYLPGSGVCDALTFFALAQVLSASVKRGGASQIGIVRRLQDRLAAQQALAQDQVGTGYGQFGPLTEAALKRFQQAQSLTPDGVLTVASYLRLREAARDAPALRKPPADGDDTAINVQLPRGGTGFIIKKGTNARDQVATERTINRLMAFAVEWASAGAGAPLRTGDLSREGGGAFGPHMGEGHSRGFALDLGLYRRDRQNEPTNITDPSYDRALTQRLITALDDSPLVTLMIFNDPRVTGSSKLRRDREGRHTHDNHIHVEFRRRAG